MTMIIDFLGSILISISLLLGLMEVLPFRVAFPISASWLCLFLMLARIANK